MKYVIYGPLFQNKEMRHAQARKLLETQMMTSQGRAETPKRTVNWVQLKWTFGNINQTKWLLTNKNLLGMNPWDLH